MMKPLTLTTLAALSLLLSIGCGPEPLTVGDKDTTGEAGASGTDDPKDPKDMPGGSSGTLFTCADEVKTQIASTLVCDMKEDCPGGSDEWSCPANPWKCDDGPTLTFSVVCNGYEDCPLGDDELYCSGVDPRCPNGAARGLPLDLELMCSHPITNIDCIKLVDESLLVPKNWANGDNCLRRKSDRALFIVTQRLLARDWNECTPEELALAKSGAVCPVEPRE